MIHGNLQSNYWVSAWLKFELMGQQEQNEILPLLCLYRNHRPGFYKLMWVSHTQTYMTEFDKEISL